MLHLIIPAYQHLVIEEPVCLPTGLEGTTTFHGKIHSGIEFV